MRLHALYQRTFRRLFVYFFPLTVFFCLEDKNAQEEKQILEQRLIALVPPGCEENPPWWLPVEMSENLPPSPPPPLSQSPSPRISRRGIFIKFPGYLCPLSTHHLSTLLLISSWSWSIALLRTLSVCIECKVVKANGWTSRLKLHQT